MVRFAIWLVSTLTFFALFYLVVSFVVWDRYWMERIPEWEQTSRAALLWFMGFAAVGIGSAIFSSRKI